MKWQDLDAKAQRRALIFFAILAAMVIVLFWPASRPRMRPVRQVDPRRGVEQTGRGTPPPAPRPVPPPAKDAGMLGKWQSSMGAQMPGHGLCTLWLEVSRKADEPDKYTGAASLSCIPTAALTNPKPDTPMAVLLNHDPVFASLSGEWQKDGIVFRVDKVLNPKQCGFTGLSVSKFGSQNIGAEFQDACGGGSAMLRKAG